MTPFEALRMRKPSGSLRTGTDSNWSNVALLVGFDGANGSTTFTDESSYAHALTPAVGTAVSTTQVKYGTGSGLFNGSGTSIAAPDHSIFTFAGDFTMEAWVYYTSATGNQTFCSHNVGWAWGTTGAVMRFILDPDGVVGSSTTVSAPWTPSASQWYHVCVDRSGTTFRFYVDGAFLGSATSAVVPFDNTSQLVIGLQGAGGTNGFNGYMDELRLTSGVARYASNSGFTAPTAAYPGM